MMILVYLEVGRLRRFILERIVKEKIPQGGLEQKGYEYDVETYGKDQVANAQNPVGEKNPKKSDYEKAANKELADPDSVAGKLLSCKG